MAGFVFVLKALKIGESSSFGSNSLSVPFAEDRGQIFPHGHLLPVAAVAVSEHAVCVALSQSFCILQSTASSEREREIQEKTRQDAGTLILSKPHTLPN